MPGILYLVATPIGNLGDITLRAIEILKSADILACEDTRRTEILMRHLGLTKRLERYDEHTHGPAGRKLLEALTLGKSVALVTDAGTPVISDPGGRLVQDAIAKGIRVVPIPGACSPVAALSASGFAVDGFVFLGFLPRRPGRARRALQEALGLGKTAVVLESPFRVLATLDLVAALSPNASVVVAREITKIHEEFIRGDIDTVRKEMNNRPEKGEVVILIGAPAGSIETETE